MSVTVSPSGTVWASPAEAIGAVLDGGMELDGGTSVTVIVTWSVAVALCWSVTLRVKVMAVVELTCGAVKVVERAAGLARVMGRLESCDHR